MTDKQELAEDRTDWAEDRTILANERTFAAWMRTAMACLGIAIALQAVFGPTEPTWLARSAASIFVVTALAMIYATLRNSLKLIKRMQSHEAEPISKNYLKVIAAAMFLGCLATLYILWIV